MFELRQVVPDLIAEERPGDLRATWPGALTPGEACPGSLDQIDASDEEL